jgi:hypothetical protein
MGYVKMARPLQVDLIGSINALLNRCPAALSGEGEMRDVGTRSIGRVQPRSVMSNVTSSATAV